MMGNGWLGSVMALGFRFGLMVRSMKVHGSRARLRGLESLYIRMGKLIMVNGHLIRPTVLVFTCTSMEGSMSVT